MKRLKKLFGNILVLALVAVCVLSCTAEEEPENEPASGGFVMKARILAIGDRIEVDVIESEYSSGIHWVITSEQTRVMDEDGEKIELSDLATDDVIEIEYSGQIMMSYPPQIVAISIKQVA